MKKVCITIINFNSENETHDCLTSLSHADTSGLEVQIVVVDNGSKIPFEATLAEKRNGVVVIRLEDNYGFTGGSNVGLQYGISRGYDYLMLLNNDTLVKKDLLKELLKPFETSEKVGVVVPKIYFAKGNEYHLSRYTADELGKVFWYAGGDVDWKNVFTQHRGVDEVDHGQYDTQEATFFATGCCMMIKREVLGRVGLFDTHYFLYFEDGDLSQRILKAGYKIIYQPEAVVWHITAASSGGSGSALHDYYLTRNRLLFGMRYAPLRSKVALLRESLRLLMSGREWQKKGVKDFYLRKFGKGSYGK